MLLLLGKLNVLRTGVSCRHAVMMCMMALTMSSCVRPKLFASRAATAVLRAHVAKVITSSMSLGQVPLSSDLPRGICIDVVPGKLEPRWLRTFVNRPSNRAGRVGNPTGDLMETSNKLRKPSYRERPDLDYECKDIFRFRGHTISRGKTEKTARHCTHNIIAA